MFVYPREIKTNVHLHKNVPGSFIHYSQKMETTEMALKRTDTQIVIYLCHMILIGNYKNWTTHKQEHVGTRHKRVHSVWFHWPEVWEQAKLTHAEGTQRKLREWWNVLDLDRITGYTGIYTSQNSLNYACNFCASHCICVLAPLD